MKTKKYISQPPIYQPRMQPITRTKSRPVAHNNWEERASEDLNLKTLWETLEPIHIGMPHRKRLASLPSLPIQHELSVRDGFADFAKAIKDADNSITMDYNSRNRTESQRLLPMQIKTSTSQSGMFTNEASLKHARRKMRLTSDFDEMLLKGFASLNQIDPEFTLFFTLTPTVANHLIHTV
ncbi:hypothetical protein DSO57_1007502 [Entomophthora muscae]|uniref:Uncharacterized protein n=1 Tax=Entomophthora muscae TaxID=34485 RepID=A0ACC2UGZ4_9FUNG|nr:hypothetical protein DSO57_1007502 [Entomophthora muscae]